MDWEELKKHVLGLPEEVVRVTALDGIAQGAMGLVVKPRVSPVPASWMKVHSSVREVLGPFEEVFIPDYATLHVNEVDLNRTLVGTTTDEYLVLVDNMKGRLEIESETISGLGLQSRVVPIQEYPTIYHWLTMWFLD